MNEGQISSRVDGIFLGKIAHHWEGREHSAIDKTAVTGPQDINKFGFLTDEQADLKNHGGLDKAIHHYPSDHYQTWINEGEIPAGTIPAAFGENIATIGLTEQTLCIGDTFRLGTAIVQISQGRQPCWKVSEFTQNKRMAYLFQKTARTGWYYRVLEPGHLDIGDNIDLIERRQPDWTVARVTTARLTKRVAQQDAETLAVLPELADGWRQAFQRMASGNLKEDTGKRLIGN